MIAGGSVKVIASPTLLLNQTTPLTHKRASEKNTEPVTQPPPSKVVVVGDGTVSQNKDQNNSIFIFSVMLIFQNTIYTNLLYFDAHFILHHRFLRKSIICPPSTMWCVSSKGARMQMKERKRKVLSVSHALSVFLVWMRPKVCKIASNDIFMKSYDLRNSKTLLQWQLKRKVC